MKFQKSITAALCAASLGACSSKPPLKTVDQVNLDRFSGDWYVIAAIPTPLEDEAYNAIESYELKADGTMATTFTFRKGGFDGPLKTYTPTGFPDPDSNNAVWGMRFIWPIKADYRVMYLDDDYRTTVIGRNARDYVWIMARTPQIDAATRERLDRMIAAAGYDISQIRDVPQQWN